MKSSNARYTFKTWITSVLLSPAIYIIVQLYVNSLNRLKYNYTGFESYPQMYLVIALISFIFSFATWFVFWLLIEVIDYYNTPAPLKPWVNCLTGVVLTVATFWMFVYPDFDIMFTTLMFANVFCIGAGTFIYKQG